MSSTDSTEEICEVCEQIYPDSKAMKSHMLAVHQVKIPSKKIIAESLNLLGFIRYFFMRYFLFQPPERHWMGKHVHRPDPIKTAWKINRNVVIVRKYWLGKRKWRYMCKNIWKRLLRIRSKWLPHLLKRKKKKKTKVISMERGVQRTSLSLNSFPLTKIFLEFLNIQYTCLLMKILVPSFVTKSKP